MDTTNKCNKNVPKPLPSCVAQWIYKVNWSSISNDGIAKALSVDQKTWADGFKCKISNIIKCLRISLGDDRIPSSCIQRKDKTAN